MFFYQCRHYLSVVRLLLGFAVSPPKNGSMDVMFLPSIRKPINVGVYSRKFSLLICNSKNAIERKEMWLTELYLPLSEAYNILLVLRYEYIRKNASTAPTIIPAVVSQNANYTRSNGDVNIWLPPELIENKQCVFRDPRGSTTCSSRYDLKFMPNIPAISRNKMSWYGSWIMITKSRTMKIQ